MSSSFSKEFVLFCREAEIAAISTYEGLNFLGKAAKGMEAYYSQAFFNLSVGLERVSKLVLVLHYIHENKGNFPENKYIKKYSHNLKGLILKCSEINQILLGEDFGFQQFEAAIINELSNFASLTRYYNLDELTNIKTPNEQPVTSWRKMVINPLISHYNPDLHLSYDDTTDGFRLYARIHEIDKFSQKYQRYYTAKIAQKLVKLLSFIQKKLHENMDNENIPFLDEFFLELNYADEKTLKNRKRWQLYH